jgi:hypothetical protein
MAIGAMWVYDKTRMSRMIDVVDCALQPKAIGQIGKRRAGRR